MVDYERAGEEAPPIIQREPDRCEAELMSDQEVIDFIDDSLTTLMFLKDKQSKALAQVQAYFYADLACLLELGRIEREDYDVALKMEAEQ